MTTYTRGLTPSYDDNSPVVFLSEFEECEVLLDTRAKAQPPEPQQRIDVFARFRQGDLVTCSTNNSGKSWSKNTGLDIRLPSRFKFQVVGFNPERIDVFSTCDGAIDHGSWEGERWQPHGYVPSKLPDSSDDRPQAAGCSPVVVQLPSHGFIFFYVDGLTHNLWCRFGNYDRMDWSDWTFLGGKCNAEPVAISRGRNIIDLFYVDLDGGLYWKSWTDMAWKPEYEKLGNRCQGGLAAVALHRERIDVFAVGSRGELRSKVWDGKSWDPPGMGWLTLACSFKSRPAIVARGSKRFDLFIIGIDGKLYHKALDNSIWKPATGLRSLGGNFNATIPPTALLTKSGIHLFLVGGAGTSGGAYHKCWDGADEKTPWEFDQFFGWNCSTSISAIVRDIGGPK